MERSVIVIISALHEWKAVLKYHAPDSLENTPYGEFFVNRISDKNVIYIQGGWGKIKAAGSAQYAISRWNPKLMVNLGTCGGFQGRIEAGEVVLADKTIVYDLVEQMAAPESAIRAYTTTLDLSFLREPYPQKVRKTLLVSADRDLMAEEIPELITKYNAVAGDWESGAIAFICQSNGVPCLILRGVSDLVGIDGCEAYDNLSLFSERAEEVMLELMHHLPAWLECCTV